MILKSIYHQYIDCLIRGVITIKFCLILYYVHSQSIKPFPAFLDQWQAEGTWGDGSTFKQEISFEYQLDSTIIAVRSKGFTDKEQNTYGLRNFGIRRISTSSDTSSFYEFDVFGGLTEGKMIRNNRDLYYQYQYGEYTVTDYWQYENDSTYLFTVGDYQDGVWKQKYLETKFHKVKPNSSQVALKKLKSSLVGSWKSDAWDGQKSAIWMTDDHQNLMQRGTYIDDQQNTHEFTYKIEIIDDDLVLICLPKNDSPTIYKAINLKFGEITFENLSHSSIKRIGFSFNDKGYKERFYELRPKAPTWYIFENDYTRIVE